MTAVDPLAPFERDPDRAGLFLDFDGVLSEIASDHGEARPRDAVPGLLVALVAGLGRVGVISGRPITYLAGWLPEEVDLVGLYGLEWRSGGRHHTLPGAEEWRDVVAEVAARAQTRFGAEPVELKGLSLTIHYRLAGGRENDMARWAHDQAEISGLEWRRARMSFELHPPMGCDKGTALLAMASELDPVAYMGDDFGDLPAFDGLDELSSRGVQTVRIAVRSSEMPPILMQRADVVVDGPAGAEALLRDLVARVSSSV